MAPPWRSSRPVSLRDNPAGHIRRDQRQSHLAEPEPGKTQVVRRLRLRCGPRPLRAVPRRLDGEPELRRKACGVGAASRLPLIGYSGRLRGHARNICGEPDRPGLRASADERRGAAGRPERRQCASCRARSGYAGCGGVRASASYPRRRSAGCPRAGLAGPCRQTLRPASCVPQVRIGFVTRSGPSLQVRVAAAGDGEPDAIVTRLAYQEPFRR